MAAICAICCKLNALSDPVQRVHLKCESCVRAVCKCQFYGSPFSGSAAKYAADCLRVVASEVLRKGLRSLPLRFQPHAGLRVASKCCNGAYLLGFGHSQAMVIHQDWTFAQFRGLTSKADTRSSASPERSMSPRSRRSNPSPERTAAVLAAGPLPADRVRLRQPFPPSLIVLSCRADEFLWAKVLNLGGFDVLMTPFEAEEVL